MSNHLIFARNLVKGKIAETIFAQMFRETNIFTVIEFGYEKIVPELVQHGYDPNEGVIETIRSAPDFAVINQKDRKVHLVEVKYLHHLNPEYVLGYAERMSKYWNPSYLFVATQDGFYLSEISDVIKKKGFIVPLQHDQISYELQEKYLKILVDFEAAN
jgi:hypothetical protein